MYPPLSLLFHKWSNVEAHVPFCLVPSGRADLLQDHLIKWVSFSCSQAIFLTTLETCPSLPGMSHYALNFFIPAWCLALSVLTPKTRFWRGSSCDELLLRGSICKVHIWPTNKPTHCILRCMCSLLRKDSIGDLSKVLQWKLQVGGRLCVLISIPEILFPNTSHMLNIFASGLLAVSVSKTRDSWSWDFKFKAHLGCRDYIVKCIFKITHTYTSYTSRPLQVMGLT